ncbi:MAG: CotH kinase family protein [Bacteroidales bacterium]|nr:CotH kinase family protein [Bacteroidales bacterium]MCF8404395.1 CotH kinase family protein [Bacteroidales bacterium]
MKNKKQKYISSKSLAVLFILFFLFKVLWLGAQACTYTLSMQDSYGDGWNGAYLEVFVNEGLVGTFAAVDEGSIEEIDVLEGDWLELYYTSGEYENENTYQLFNPGWNTVFADGPNPDTGNVFSSFLDCDSTMVPGGNPCTAIVIDTGCFITSNIGMPGTGNNPGCANFQGADIWFTIQVPPSGNLSFSTQNGDINDTGIAIWTDSCTNLQQIGCDDDGNNGYYSLLSVYDLDPGQWLYAQVWGYGGNTGSFEMCVSDLGTVTLESSTLPIIVINTFGQTIPQEDKINAWMEIKYNGPDSLTFLIDSSNVYNGHIGIEIRGATSAGYPQKPYNIETRTDSGLNNNVSLFGMPPENDWVLLSNYNDRSLIRNTLAFKLFEQMGNYSVRTCLCEVMVDSSYKGVYVFGEKIKQDNNRVDIAKLLPADTLDDELTGGYILEQNYWNASNSFLSNYSPIDHPEFDVHFVYKYPKASEINDPQKEYIAAFVDSLETALYSDDFMDPETGYRKYMDVSSFIDYFLVNELSRNNDGFKKSVFFHKDKFSNGGRMKAGPVWDFDWAWKNLNSCSIFQNTDGSGWAHLINDCPTDNYSCGWYIRLLQDNSFANELRCRYENFRLTILDSFSINNYIDSIQNLVEDAQARHFQKWPILGISGPAPEIGEIATTYNAELDTLKAWINIRLQWLDANIPGQCLSTTSIGKKSNFLNTFICYPNPALDEISVEWPGKVETIGYTIYSIDGCIHKEGILNSSGKTKINISELPAGMYFLSIKSTEGILVEKLIKQN